jgi:hypothetical protein
MDCHERRHDLDGLAGRLAEQKPIAELGISDLRLDLAQYVLVGPACPRIVGCRESCGVASGIEAFDQVLTLHLDARDGLLSRAVESESVFYDCAAAVYEIRFRCSRSLRLLPPHPMRRTVDVFHFHGWFMAQLYVAF